MINRDRGSDPKLTLFRSSSRPCRAGLAEWPMLNATFDDEAMVITRHGAVQMGVATQTPNGLMVTTIRDAQSRSVWQLALGDPAPVRGRPRPAKPRARS